jgi:periplasmic divalent cation tolerance protein
MPTAYITAPPDTADEIARTLVAEQLAACVNRVPVESVYRWKGEVHEESEVALLAKTTDEQYGALQARVLELHPHDVPCIERFDETDLLDAFGEWRETVTAGDT